MKSLLKSLCHSRHMELYWITEIKRWVCGQILLPNETFLIQHLPSSPHPTPPWGRDSWQRSLRVLFSPAAGGHPVCMKCIENFSLDSLMGSV